MPLGLSEGAMKIFKQYINKGDYMKTKIKIKDLNLELMNLYYQDGSFNTREVELYENRVSINTDTGSELGASEVLNKEAEGVFYPDEDKLALEEYRTEYRTSSSKFKNRGLYWSSEDQALTVFRNYKGTESLNSAALFVEDFATEYEPDFQEQLENEVEFTHSDFITDAQKKLNFNFFMGRLAQANNFSKLKIVRESVLAGQKGSWFFMQREDAKIFWDAYNKKKEKLNEIKNKKRVI